MKWRLPTSSISSITETAAAMAGANNTKTIKINVDGNDSGEADMSSSSSSNNNDSNKRRQASPSSDDVNSNNNNNTSSITAQYSYDDEKLQSNSDGDYNTSSTSTRGAQSTSAEAATSSSSSSTSNNNSSNNSNLKNSDTATKIIEDDAGNDHAEPLANPWKPQNSSTTCDFTHTISDYAQKRESGCKKAEYSATTVDDNGNRWRLIVYVNGNGRASNHHLSLFLQVADAEELPFGWKKSVSYVLTLEHPNGSLCSYAKRNPDKTFKMCPKAIDWGWSQFITSDRIQQEGFIQNDSLIVKASVTVKTSTVTIDEEDAELYLKCAVEEGDAKAVKLCLEQGASVNCQFKDDLYTPLHTACSSSINTSTMDVLHLLLKEGADGNACNKWKETPLLIAANNGNHPAVEALLYHGADPSLCSEAGWSALTFAAHKGYDEIVYLLLRAGAPPNCRVTEDSSTPLHKACAGSKPGHQGCVQLLISKGADIHALNKWRETPLLTAANHGQAMSAMALLEAGADPCKCTDTGWSPLSIAAYKGHDDVVRLLLEEGAPTEEDDPTLSALLQAATKGLPETVELLLSHGADHTVTTKKGDTALSILVEQNLIDTAVEMVTAYNASIPRCSRDRKKVQRARLLINLRMKQLERECRDLEIDDDETDDEIYDLVTIPQHDDDSAEDLDSPRASGRKAKKNKVSPDKSAEERAKAAEEELLRELEKEDEKAKKEEAEANTKRTKKRKKKEKERQQKLKEEQERREKEAEEEERQRLKREKEQQERESRLLEQRKKEEQEWLEHEKMMEAKKKEKERASTEHKQVTGDVTSKNTTAAGTKKSNTLKVAGTVSQSRQSVTARDASPPVPVAGNRRWETSKKSVTKNGISTPKNTVTASTTKSITNGVTSASVDTNQGEPSRATTSQSTPDPASPSSGDSPLATCYDSVDRQIPRFVATQKNQIDYATNSKYQYVFDESEMEHPSIVLLRYEKLMQLLQQCTSVLDETTIRRIFYKWVLRSSHSEMKYIDPFIPSWLDKSTLQEFMLRQFVSESRDKNVDFASLKGISTTVTNACMAAAKEVWRVKQNLKSSLGNDWNDASIGMTILESPAKSQNAVINITFSSHQAFSISPSEFISLRDRFIGTSSRFLAAIFCAKVWYQTASYMAGASGLDMRIPTTAMSCFSAEAAVSAELWSTPFTVLNSNVFWGKFQAADACFGGQPPFSKLSSAVGNHVLAQVGGTIVSLLPPDNVVAIQYIKTMVDIIDAAEKSKIAVSFLVVVTSECFPEVVHNIDSLLLHFDSRLDTKHSAYVQRADLLMEYQHSFTYGELEAVTKPCTTKSLLLLLQSEDARSRFVVSDNAWSKIVAKLSYQPVALFQDDSFIPSVPFPNSFQNQQASQSTPAFMGPDFTHNRIPESPYRSVSVGTDYADTTNATSQNGFSPTPGNDGAQQRSRRGRLFDLVDDVEEDTNDEHVDLVSGMLNTLGMGLFNTSSDVDIEAISLMEFDNNNVSPRFPQGSSSNSTSNGPFR